MNMATDESENDPRILTLAAEIAEAVDREVPILLIKVRDVFNEAQPGSKILKQVKEDIWNYEIIKVLILVLKQNFDNIEGQWRTAAELATFASNIFIGFDPPDSDSHEYYGILLPNASENILMLARKLQLYYIEQDDGEEKQKKDMLNHFRTALEALNTLFTGHAFLTDNVLRSPWLLQMLISDDADTAHSVLNVVQYAIRVNTRTISNLDEQVLHALLDEMVFKVASGVDKYVANTAIGTLVVICEEHPKFIEVICTRYRGLRPLLSRWSGQGLSRDLKKFAALLEAGNARRAESEKFHQAATVIQAIYRGFKTRQSLKKANTAFSRFQRSFRHRRKVQRSTETEQRTRSNLQHQLVVARKKAMRATREKQIEIISMLPPSAVQKYLEGIRDSAAVKIQSVWRGHHKRKELASRREYVQQTNAAIVVQRAIRKFLRKKERLRQEPPTWLQAEGLTDERRVQLQRVILERREANPPRNLGREEQEQLHDQCQSLLKRYVFSHRMNRRKQLHREALMAGIETDCSLLLGAPKLGAVGDDSCQNYVSYSVPVATRARDHHNTEIRLLNQPWWRKLGDEFQDSKYEDENIF